VTVLNPRTLSYAAFGVFTAVLASLLTSWLYASGPAAEPVPTATEPVQETTTAQTSQSVLALPRPSVMATTATVSPSKAIEEAPRSLLAPEILGDNAKEQIALLTEGRLVEALYEQVAPSVVGIQVEAQSDTSTTLLTDSGSGIIYSAAGEILTSADLLQIALDRSGKLLESSQILVRVQGENRLFEASLSGMDRTTGIAVLSIDPGQTELVPARFNRLDAPRIGQLVFFLSFPDDMVSEGCLTSGLVTARHQPVLLENGTSVEMVRSNAPILASGQGGPLLNLAGEVIAMANTSQLSETYESLSYAIETPTIIDVAESLLGDPPAAGQPWLGIAVLKDESFAELQELYKFPDGLYVSHVITDSPAYLADIRRGDIITSVNEEPVRLHQSLSSILAQHEPGDQLVLGIYRRSDKQTHAIKVYLKETND